MCTPSNTTPPQVPAELWRFPDRTNLTGKIINSYLESKVDMPDEAIHLLFAANRWECRWGGGGRAGVGVMQTCLTPSLTLGHSASLRITLCH